MKNLWFTLLASVVLCGSSFVFNGSGERSVLGLIMAIRQGNIEIDEVIERQDFSLKEQVFNYREMAIYGQLWQKSAQFIDEETLIYETPKSRKAATLFMPKWNKINDAYFENFIKNEKDQESLQHSLNFSINADFYHHNKVYRDLLKETMMMSIKTAKVGFVNFFLKRTEATRSGFSYGEIKIPANLRLKRKETSEIPMVVYFNKFGQILYQNKVWINNQEIFNREKYNLEKRKYSLIYNEEDSHHIKVEFRQSYDSPIIVEERTYNFKINECN